MIIITHREELPLVYSLRKEWGEVAHSKESTKKSGSKFGDSKAIRECI